MIHARLRAAAARTADYQGAVIASGPLCYWQMDETAGSTMVDAMGTQNGAYANSPVLGEPPLITAGTSVLFQKVDTDIAQVNYIAAFDTQELTVEFWMDPASPDNYSGLVIRGSGNDTDSSFLVRKFDANLQFRLLGNSTTTDCVSAYPSVPTYVACVFSLSSQLQELYINGALVDSATRTVGINTQPYDIDIARDRNYSTRQYDGHLDEVAYYTRALTGAEILSHYEAA